MRSTLSGILVLVVILAAGDTIARKPRSVPSATPTFSREVAPILQRNCQSCHREGEVAPFPLMTYADAKPRAGMIKLVTGARRMPPWPPSGTGRAFHGERTLTEQEIATIGRWVDSGAPEGNPRDLPPPLPLRAKWPLGTPDRIYKMPVPYTPAAGVDTYRCFPVENESDSVAYVTAVDTRPGDRTIVHHVVLYIDARGESQALDAADPGPGYTCFGGPRFAAEMLGGWGPGSPPLSLPDGVGIEVPAKSRVVLQVHYHGHRGHGTHAQAQADQTEAGVYFSRTRPKELLRFVPLQSMGFRIPAGDPSYEVTASMKTTTPAKLWLIAPHMHLLGKSIRADATFPDSTTMRLINVPRWEFNWQGVYRYQEPVELPAGTTISLRALYDNSSANPRNPNTPPKTVAWGEWTTDEMCVVLLGLTAE